MPASYTFVRYGHEITKRCETLMEACEEAIEDAENGFCALTSVSGEGRMFKHVWDMRTWIEENKTEKLLRDAYHSEDISLIRNCLYQMARNLSIDVESENHE